MDKISREREAADAMLRAAPGERRQVAQSLSREWGVSERAVYRYAKAGGWESGRKVRKDKGSRMMDDCEIDHVAGFIRLSKRRSRTMIMDTPTALDIAAHNGLPIVAASTFNRYLRASRVSKADMQQALEAPPHINLLSKHPNHVHLFDITPCIQYFFDDQKGLQDRDMKKEFYLGKPENIAKIRKRLLRFVVVDHWSNTVYVKYFHARGEKAIDVAEFLIEAWSGEGRDCSKWPFRGAPEILYCDKGSAAMSGLVRDFCSTVGTRVMSHLPGNPRAKGAVEGMMKIWQTKFESRLAVHSAPDLETLNAWTLDYLVRHNNEGNIRATGRSRTALWSDILPDQLRLLPTPQILRQYLRTPAESRLVKGNLTIAYQGLLFRVPDPNLEGKTVEVRLNPYRWLQERKAIDVYFNDATGQRLHYEAREVRYNEAGMIDGERTAVIGETYNRHPDSITQQALKRIDDSAEELKKAQAFGYHAEEAPISVLPRRGTEVELPTEQKPAISGSEARLELVRRLGRPLTEDEATYLEGFDRISADDVAGIADELMRMEVEEASHEIA